MALEYFNEKFDVLNLQNHQMGSQYENCNFTNCNFENHDFSKTIFIDCTFSQCNLSLIKTNKTAFRNVRFIDCKILGVRFDYCDPFLMEINAERSVFNLSSFFKLKLSKSNFSHCFFKEVDFTDTDLSESNLTYSDFLNATFYQSNLRKADFRFARNYIIDPETNSIKQAKFSREDIEGLLVKHAIFIE